jgi:hypothetical protein
VHYVGDEAEAAALVEQGKGGGGQRVNRHHVPLRLCYPHIC